MVSLTLNPATISGGSGASSTGTVTLSGPAPMGGTVVSLSNSNTGLASDFGTTGTCTFVQECLLGCLTSPQEGFKRNDTCATSGPFPIALNPSYLVGGERSAGTVCSANRRRCTRKRW